MSYPKRRQKKCHVPITGIIRTTHDSSLVEKDFKFKVDGEMKDFPRKVFWVYNNRVKFNKDNTILMIDQGYWMSIYREVEGKCLKHS